MGGKTAQEYDSSQSFLFLQFQSHFCLILPLIYMLKDQCIFLFLDLFFKYFDHAVKKWIADTFDQNGNGSGIGTFQITGTVVWNIMVFLDDLHDHFLCLRIDIWMIVDRAGNRTDSHAADPCHILDRNTLHAFTSFPFFRNCFAGSQFYFLLMQSKSLPGFCSSQAETLC